MPDIDVIRCDMIRYDAMTDTAAAPSHQGHRANALTRCDEIEGQRDACSTVSMGSGDSEMHRVGVHVAF